MLEFFEIFSWFPVYVYILLLSLAVSLILTGVARRLALRYNIVDHPSGRKAHQKVTPYLGGAGICLSFGLVVVVHAALGYWLLSSRGPLAGYVTVEMAGTVSGVGEKAWQLGGLLAMGFIVFLVGLMDDVRRLSPVFRLVAVFVCATILFFFGVRIKVFEFLPGGISGTISYLVTVIWIVGITNSFNLLDNMDGLSAGVAAVAATVFMFVAWELKQTYMVLALLCLIGSTLGFLWYNYPPAKIFMGDAGALFLGFTLASLTVLSSYYSKNCPTAFPLLMPVIILALPLFDTISVIIIRIKTGNPIYVGDRNHFSHRLVELGFSPKRAVQLHYLITAVVGMSAIPLLRLGVVESSIVFGQVLFVFAIIAILEFTAKRRNSG